MTDSRAPIDANERQGLIAVSNVDNTTIVRLWADPVNHRLLVDSSATITELAATGSVNGVNVTFTFTSAPTYIVSDHAWYKATNSNGTTNWTGTTTVTMTIPPSEDIFGIS